MHPQLKETLRCGCILRIVFVSGDSLETSGFRNETRLFKYQYDQLKPERKDAYLLEVVLMNLGQPKA